MIRTTKEKSLNYFLTLLMAYSCPPMNCLNTVPLPPEPSSSRFTIFGRGTSHPGIRPISCSSCRERHWVYTTSQSHPIKLLSLDAMVSQPAQLMRSDNGRSSIVTIYTVLITYIHRATITYVHTQVCDVCLVTDLNRSKPTRNTCTCQFSCDYSCTTKNLSNIRTCALGDFIGLYMYLIGDVVH